MKTSLKLIATLFIALSQIGISTAADFDDKLGETLVLPCAIRGEFVGELGETILFEPPTSSIVPSRF